MIEKNNLQRADKRKLLENMGRCTCHCNISKIILKIEKGIKCNSYMNI